ncbi:unnamed protein product [Phytophthora fragariaefolia]|uniref:Unnamed protein product n=1 Tax=Phytophthora fragariaefolia TaxID=1490495 RepID=A0A9W6XPT4_9STRA|nr:unnamed protein product [Phytophthora fragariaefolia]
MIPSRWLLTGEPLDGYADRFADTMQKFNIEDIETPPSHVLGHNEKYRSGLVVCQRIAEVVADKGSRSFQFWLNYLLDLEKVARHNDVPPPHSTEELDTHSVGSGDPIRRVGSVGEQATSVGEQVTSVGEQVTSIGEPSIGHQCW